jgi:hypothetical protein
MMVATRSFPIRYEGQDDEIVAGQSRCSDDHPLVQQYPDAWREEGLADELAIRSARIAELNDRDTRVSYTPQTESGKREQREAQFWGGVQRMLEPVVPAAERAEQRIFDEALAAFDASEARQQADFNADTEHEFRFDRDGWNRRVAD